MGKRKRRGKHGRVRLTARQIAYLTRGVANPNVAAIARVAGYGKDTAAIERLIKQAAEND